MKHEPSLVTFLNFETPNVGHFEYIYPIENGLNRSNEHLHEQAKRKYDIGRRQELH